MRLLKDLTDLQIGYQHREKIGMAAVGTHRLIQVKDLDFEGRFTEVTWSMGRVAPYLWTGSLYMVTPKGDPARYMVDQGDVLFLYRGQRAVAVPVLESLQNTMAAYYFYILRPRTSEVLPEYLAWYINQPPAQSFLESHMTGSHMKIIRKPAIENLLVPVPPLQTQRVVVGIERLRQKEQACLAQLSEARDQLVNSICLEAARREGGQ